MDITIMITRIPTMTMGTTTITMITDTPITTIMNPKLPRA